MSRRTSIRKRCIDCSAGSHSDVQTCQHNTCPLHPYRMGIGKQDARTRDKAIKAYCAWCSITRAEVLQCPVTTCPLHPYRKSKSDSTTRTAMFCNHQPHRGHFETSDSMSIPMEAPGT